MKKVRTNLSVSSIKANAGQLPWLPKNPRQWTQTAIDNEGHLIYKYVGNAKD